VCVSCDDVACLSYDHVACVSYDHACATCYLCGTLKPLPWATGCEASVRAEAPPRASKGRIARFRKLQHAIDYACKHRLCGVWANDQKGRVGGAHENDAIEGVSLARRGMRHSDVARCVTRSPRTLARPRSPAGSVKLVVFEALRRLLPQAWSQVLPAWPQVRPCHVISLGAPHSALGWHRLALLSSCWLQLRAHV
jgi:hypothetical protein